MKKGHFWLTCVAQKRCCLSSLLQLLNFLMDFILNCINPYLSKAWHKCSPFKGIPTGNNTCTRASDISRKKSKISQDFQGQIRGKIRRFRGKKVKIRWQIGRFCGIFAEEKSKFAKNRLISGEKIQISKDFQGQIIRKIGWFHGKFQGETSPRSNQ